MRAHLAAHGVRDRTVRVTDSVKGLPRPSVKEDVGYDLSKRHCPILAIDEARVRALFERYDLLDDHVRFLPGWFRDSLPGGFIIVDDYGALPPCRQAVEDFRTARGIDTPLEHIDWTGAVWRKEGERLHVSTGSEAAFTEVRRASLRFEDCIFYHSITTADGDIPGEWDLRDTVDAYLGNVPFDGKSVLEIGPASGFLSFHMERAGASVTAVEPTMERLWDTFPLHGFDVDTWRREFFDTITSVRNSFWYLHHLYGSQVRLIERVPEAIPQAVGDFDIGLLGSILLSSRSPTASVMSSSGATTRAWSAAATSTSSLPSASAT